MNDAFVLGSEPADRLSRIETMWTVVLDAHDGADSNRFRAQHELLTRYGSAIQRYLFGALRDPIAAEDAYQEFAYRFLRGDYKSASPDRGRFRSFLKSCCHVW